MATRREIAVRLKAEVTDFKRQMGESGKALDDLAKKAGGAEKVAGTSMGRLVQSAELQRESWDRVGTTMLGVGTAITAVGAAALTTGVSYNTLQQQSRAALTTLLGSAEKANAQMDKLDEFARTSPFSKATFISAQQQMLAFGIEAEKVVPILDAVQNAVAAAGGSNADIEGIVATLSKISSTGKVTAEDLNELGNRGVDAATLIGSQMGKTGAQIREDITAGTLGASEAIDALTAGMTERFDGAADGVKETFVGAVDRVKAAWRDLSSELASPIVGPEGGGLGVAALNGLADAMRQFQDAPDWVKGTTVALAGLTGAASLGAGAVLVGLPRYIEFKNALGQLAEISPRAAAGISKTAGVLKTVGGYSAGIAATAVAAGALVDALKGYDTAPGAEALAKAIRDISEADFNAVGGQFENFGTVLGMSVNQADSLTDAFDQMLAPSVTDRISSFFDGIPGVTGYMENLESRVAGLDSVLAGMLQAGEVEAVERFRQGLLDAGYSAEEINSLLPETADALIGVGEASGVAAGGQEGLADATAEATVTVDEQVASIGSLVETLGVLYGNVLSQRDAQRQVEESVDDLTESLKENGTTMDITTEKGRANQAALDDVAASSWKLIDSMKENGATAAELQGTMSTLRGRFVAAAEAAGYGADEANALADQLGLIPENVNTHVSTTGVDEAIGAAATLRQIIDGIPRNVNVAFNGSVSGSLYSASSMANSLVRTPGLATGGYVSGPGTSTSDSIPARLSNGEYVIKADSVQRYGRSFFDAVNAQRFATGGMVGGGSVSAPVSGAVVNYNQNGPVYATDPQAVARASVARLRDAMSGAGLTGVGGF